MDGNSSKVKTKFFAATLSILLLIGGIELNPGHNITQNQANENENMSLSKSAMVGMLSNTGFQESFKVLFKELIRSEIPVLLNPIMGKLSSLEVSTTGIKEDLTALQNSHEKIIAKNAMLKMNFVKVQEKLRIRRSQ